MGRRENRTWFEHLRSRFIEVARRRVARDNVEDVVQESIRIVVQKGFAPGGRSVDGLPPIAWCFQVLRNVIGNHYQREGTRRRRLESSSTHEQSTQPRFAEELSSQETLTLIQRACESLQQTDPQCGRYVARLAEGAQPRDIAAEEDVAPAVFYRRL